MERSCCSWRSIDKVFLKTREEFVDNLLRLPVGIRRRTGRHSEDERLGELIDDCLQLLLFSRDREGREAVCIQKSVQNGRRGTPSESEPPTQLVTR